MREILFRGRNEMFGWIYGFYVYTGGLRHIITDLSGISYRVGSKTVGQFTGLLDENGTKIFEGDIVEAWSQGLKTIGKIKQRIDGLWLIYPAWANGKFWGLMPDKAGNTSVKVIGNIHDNPELLEVTP